MPYRVIDLSDEPAKLSVRNFLLRIERENKETVTLPLAELAVMVVSHPQITYTQAVLTGICSSGGVFITCDEKHLPIGILCPIAANFVQTERFTAQAKAAEPARKKIWQQLIKAKIRSQGKLLEEIHGDDHGLIELSKKVRSGDTSNLEAQAARRYWPFIFKNPSFKRNREAEDQNRFLNYGYIVLRAVAARSICAAGLHPSIGVHHHNRYDAFCLASDMMEPFRTVVDAAVYAIVEEFGEKASFDKEVKGTLLSTFLKRYDFEGEQRTLFDITSKTAASLVHVFMGTKNKIVIPNISFKDQTCTCDAQETEDSEGDISTNGEGSEQLNEVNELFDDEGI
jgi:CRISPR-associated protein Cas1